jgi:HAD superfamily hydrolase (TIGR01484 family)
MRFIAFACDYDETLARLGRVSPEGVLALKQLAASGRKLLLVTGRELDDLLSVFPAADLFDRIVAENGAVLYRPATRERKCLAERAPEKFVDLLSRRGVSPLSVGEIIVATIEPNQEAVLEAIRDLGLELQVIFNKGAVMVLPSGVNKGTGLRHALRELGISIHNCVAVGDAENDHAFLSISECAVAVANALPTLKERADLVTSREATDGVIELIEQLCADDLRCWDARLSRHDISIGTDEHGLPLRLRSHGPIVLIASSSRADKSPATALIARLAEQEYQCCLVDAGANHEGIERLVSLGTIDRIPVIDEVLQVLGNPESNCAVNLIGIPPEERPSFLAKLWPRLQSFRARAGRPAWIAIDEADQLLPAAVPPAEGLYSLILISSEPGPLVAHLSSLEEEIAASDSSPATVAAAGKANGAGIPRALATGLKSGEALVWSRRPPEGPKRVRLATPGEARRPRQVT